MDEQSNGIKLIKGLMDYYKHHLQLQSFIELITALSEVFPKYLAEKFESDLADNIDDIALLDEIAISTKSHIIVGKIISKLNKKVKRNSGELHESI